MSSITRTAVAAAALAALAASPAAWAAASASASISVVTITLFDLDPGDGIAPAITFSDEASYSYAGANGVYDYDSAALFYQPTSATATNGSASANGATDAAGASGMSMVSSLGNGYSYGQFYAGFEVTPWTGVVMTTTMVGSATTTVGSDGVNAESASAYGSIYLNIYTVNGDETHQGYRYVNADYVWDGSQYTGESNSFNGTVRLSYANLSGDTVAGYYQAYAQSSANSTIPVPEPGTYGLLLAGLVGVVVAVRHRRA